MLLTVGSLCCRKNSVGRKLFVAAVCKVKQAMAHEPSGPIIINLSEEASKAVWSTVWSTEYFVWHLWPDIFCREAGLASCLLGPAPLKPVTP